MINPLLSHFLSDLVIFAGNRVTFTEDTTTMRIHQLLQWMDAQTQSPWADGEEPHVSFQDAKRIAALLRRSYPTSADPQPNQFVQD